MEIAKHFRSFFKEKTFMIYAWEKVWISMKFRKFRANVKLIQVCKMAFLQQIYSSVHNNRTGTIIYLKKNCTPTLLLDTLRLLILDILFHDVLYIYIGT